MLYGTMPEGVTAGPYTMQETAGITLLPGQSWYADEQGQYWVIADRCPVTGRGRGLMPLLVVGLLGYLVLR
jgi:hypothetical protein